MMRTEELTGAVTRVLDQGEDLGEALAELLAELADILSVEQEKIADEAYLRTARDRLASAKDSATEALAPLRKWLKPRGFKRRYSDGNGAHGTILPAAPLA